jgi:hypothetical protein
MRFAPAPASVVAITSAIASLTIDPAFQFQSRGLFAVDRFIRSIADNAQAAAR